MFALFRVIYLHSQELNWAFRWEGPKTDVDVRGSLSGILLQMKQGEY